MDGEGSQEHHRPKADGRGDLPHPAIHELDRRHGVAKAYEQAQGVDRHQGGRASHDQQGEPQRGRDPVAAGRQERHLADRYQCVLQDSRPAAELGRRGVGIVGALERVEDVVRHVQAEVDGAGSHEGDQRRHGVEEAGSRGHGESEKDRSERGAQERCACGAEEQQRRRQARANRHASGRGQGLEVPPGLRQTALVGRRQGQVALIPCPGACRRDNESPAWPSGTRTSKSLYAA